MNFFSDMEMTDLWAPEEVSESLVDASARTLKEAAVANGMLPIPAGCYANAVGRVASDSTKWEASYDNASHVSNVEPRPTISVFVCKDVSSSLFFHDL